MSDDDRPDDPLNDPLSNEPLGQYLASALYRGPVPSSWDIEAARQRFQQQVRAERAAATSVIPRRVPLARRWAGQLIAAMALVALTISGAWLFWRRPVAQPFRDLASAPGGRATVVLRNGARLVLGPASHLRVPADFGRGARVVQLDGEAYFAVRHDASHPFTVRAGDAVVTDVGTEFDVRAYAGDRDVRVAVAAGRVCVGVVGSREKGACNAPLQVRDMAVVTDTGVVVTHGVDVALLTGWLQGRLVFNGVPLGQALRDVARVFNVEITIADSAVAGTRVTGSFDNETIDQVLDDLTSVVGARYDRRGRTVVIRQRVATRAPADRPAGPPPLNTARLDRP